MRPPSSVNGTFETCRRYLKMSAHQGRPEVISARPKRRERRASDIRPNNPWLSFTRCWVAGISWPDPQEASRSRRLGKIIHRSRWQRLGLGRECQQQHHRHDEGVSAKSPLSAAAGL